MRNIQSNEKTRGHTFDHLGLSIGFQLFGESVHGQEGLCGDGKFVAIPEPLSARMTHLASLSFAQVSPRRCRDRREHTGRRKRCPIPAFASQVAANDIGLSWRSLDTG